MNKTERITYAVNIAAPGGRLTRLSLTSFLWDQRSIPCGAILFAALFSSKNEIKNENYGTATASQLGLMKINRKMKKYP